MTWHRCWLFTLGLGVCVLIFLMREIGSPFPKRHNREEQLIRAQYMDTLDQVHTAFLRPSGSALGQIPRQSISACSQSDPAVKLIIYSKFRTGSTFTTSFFSKSPNAFVCLEPFFFERQISSTPAKAVLLLEDLFECRFEQFKQYDGHSLNNMFQLKREHLCSPEVNESLCVDALLKEAEYRCRMRSIRVVKVIRIRSLQLLEPLMRTGVKVLHLTRDPRAVLVSRAIAMRYIKWEHFRNYTMAESDLINLIMKSFVHGNIDFVHLVDYCTDVRNDLYYVRVALRSHQSEFIKNYLLVRYEDLVLNTLGEVARLYRFTGQCVDSSVKMWTAVVANPRISRKRKIEYHVFGTERYDSLSTMVKWKKTITFELVRDVQEECRNMMQLLSYSPIESQIQLKRSTETLVKPLLHESV